MFNGKDIKNKVSDKGNNFDSDSIDDILNFDSERLTKERERNKRKQLLTTIGSMLLFVLTFLFVISFAFAFPFISYWFGFASGYLVKITIGATIIEVINTIFNTNRATIELIQPTFGLIFMLSSILSTSSSVKNIRRSKDKRGDI